MRKKSILITGCSSGIGFDAAHTLHKLGWQVFATCRQQKDCDRLMEMGMDSFVLDYADSNSVQQAANTALERSHGQLDALFNNGAYAIPGCIQDLPRAALRGVFETNVFGQFELINAVLPSMQQHGHGYIINCSSVLGLVAMPYKGAYNASKFAMEGLTDTLRRELRDSGIHVCLIEPGPIRTKIRVNSQPHFERWIDVQTSPNKTLYEQMVMPRLYVKDPPPDRFELPPSAVTDKLIKALNSDKPRPRYFVTKSTYIANILRRTLSTRVLDWVLNKA